MAGLDDLEQRIKDKLALSEEHSQRRQDHLQQQMAEAEARYKRYTTVANQLMQAVVRPRMAKLQRHFANIRVPEARNGPHSCCYQFEHTDRFPATTTLELGVTRDGDVSTVVLQYKLEILPVFFPFQRQDELAMPLEQVDEAKAAAWVEEKILYFLDTYLRLETTDSYQAENMVTDPVCGMRVNKAFAPAQMTYRGTTYYFCIDQCRARFAENPEKYLAGRRGP
jgi:YHS domain-containing protein